MAILVSEPIIRKLLFCSLNSTYFGISLNLTNFAHHAIIKDPKAAVMDKPETIEQDMELDLILLKPGYEGSLFLRVIKRAKNFQIPYQAQRLRKLVVHNHLFPF
jgi:hypothetical protein